MKVRAAGAFGIAILDSVQKVLANWLWYARLRKDEE